MQIAACLGVDEADYVLVADEDGLGFGVVFGLAAVRVEEPIVIGVFVVVAGHLLLLGAFGVCLDVRVEETAAVAHVLDCCAGAESDLEGAIFANFRSAKVGLEERAHLSVTGTAIFKDEKMNVEGEHVDHDGDDNKPQDTEG